MKRSKILEMTHISGEDDPDMEGARQGRLYDKISESTVVYLPEIILVILLISAFNAVSMILYGCLYFIVKPFYLRALRRNAAFNAMEVSNFVYISMKDDEITEILCMDEDKFEPKPLDETYTVFRIEEVK